MELELQNKIKISVTENEEFKEKFAEFCLFFQKNNSTFGLDYPGEKNELKFSNEELLKLFILSNLIRDDKGIYKKMQAPFCARIPGEGVGTLSAFLICQRDRLVIDGEGFARWKRGILPSAEDYYNKIRQVVFHYDLKSPFGKKK